MENQKSSVSWGVAIGILVGVIAVIALIILLTGAVGVGAYSWVVFLFVFYWTSVKKMATDNLVKIGIGSVIGWIIAYMMSGSFLVTLIGADIAGMLALVAIALVALLVLFMIKGAGDINIIESAFFYITVGTISFLTNHAELNWGTLLLTHLVTVVVVCGGFSVLLALGKKKAATKGN